MSRLRRRQGCSKRTGRFNQLRNDQFRLRFKMRLNGLPVFHDTAVENDAPWLNLALKVRQSLLKP